MSVAYRKPRLSSDDESVLRRLVASSATTTKVLALIKAQQRKSAGRGGLFQKAANVSEVFFLSMRLPEEQIAWLNRLVAEYGMEAVIGFIECERQLRASVQDTLHQVMRPNEGAEKYRGQYDAAIRSLAAFGIDHKEAPSWEDIAARLTPEKLALVEKLEGAQLVLVPPQSRQDLVKAINSKAGDHGMKNDVYTYESEDDQLWNNGKSEKDLRWEVAFVDGRQEVPYNAQLQDGKTAYEQVKALRALHEQNELQILTGARLYLSLMMQGLIAKAPIDQKYWTVLNAEVVAKDEKSLLGGGRWNTDQVSLYYAYPDFSSGNLRLRGAVIV